MMDQQSQQSGKTGLLLAVLFLLGMLGLGAYLAFGQAGDAGQVANPAAPAVTETPANPPASKPAQTAEVPKSVNPAAPQFDEFRRETDGTTIIAGRAAPGSTVSVMVDGKEIAQTEADAKGGFALLSTITGEDGPQVMTLETDLGGERLSSDEEIILAPLALKAPDPVAPEVVSDSTISEPAPTAQTAPIAGPVTAPTALPGTDSVATAETRPVISTAPAQPAAPRMAVLRSDAEGVQLMNPVEPDAPRQVSLDTIGYSAAGEVQLAGRAQSEARQIRVYLDNTVIASLEVDPKGRWQGNLPNVDEGVYTLRVDELRADGSVSSRVETPFQRESVAILEQAKRDADGNITAITVQEGTTLWAIARERYGEGTFYLKVFEANKATIRNPDLIYPGQIFELPD